MSSEQQILASSRKSFGGFMPKQQALLDFSRKSIGDSIISSCFQGLVEKFDKISSSIKVDSKNNNLRLFDLDKESSRYQDDPHTKLRNLQNRSEINRAEVQLISQRRPKFYSIKTQRQRADSKEGYISIYNKFKCEGTIKNKIDTQHTSQDQTQANQNGPKGIKHYQQLRHHPRLLQYTLQKLHEKQQQQRQLMKKQQSKMELKQASKPSSLSGFDDFKQIIDNYRSKQVNVLQTPKTIVENQMNKFYSKSSKGKLDVKIHENERCSKLLQRQQKIVSRIQETSLSKENMKKLKQKLNVILNEINRSDMKSIQKLPKISTFTSS